MSMTKESIAQALRGVAGFGPGTDLVSGEHLLWSSVCDAYASIKLQAPPGTPTQELTRAARGAYEAVQALAQRGGTAMASFIVEFVDHAGTVVRTERFGGMKPVEQQRAEKADPGMMPATSAANAPGGGHRPISGLGGSGGASGGGASGGASGGGPTVQGKASALPNVRHVIAVGAGKGGVGKSTIALNLAVGLARRGHAVGLLDGDIYGPSMPTMLNLGAVDALVLQGMLQPFAVHGIKAMTIGKLVEPEKPLIWRGPMAHGAFKQLTEQTAWGELDYLIIDLPPGTGDVSLTMAQMLRLTGAVVVCTPQKVAQDDAVRAAKMFQQLGVPVLGVVENMSAFIADDGKAYEIFGRGGAEAMAQRLNVPFLGAVPITMSLRENSDKGDPTANFLGEDPAGRRLRTSLEELVAQLEGQVALASLRSGERRPTLTIS